MPLKNASVPAAVEQLRQFYGMGRQSRAATPEYPVGGAAKDQKSAEAQRLGVNPEVLRVARLFAKRIDKAGGEAELEQRIAEAQARDYPPGWSILATIYELPAALRDGVWKRCLEGRWSRKQLEGHRAELLRHKKKKLTEVEGAGRTYNFSTPEESQQRIEHEIDTLRRLLKAAIADPVFTNTAADRGYRKRLTGLRDKLTKFLGKR